MRIFKAFPAYIDYQNYFRIKHPELEKANFSDQLQEYGKDFFPWICTWKRNLELHEGVEVFETIQNDYILQRKWTQENNVRFNEENWQTEVVLNQIESFSPDIVVLYPPEVYNENFIRKLKSRKKVEIIAGYDGIARNNRETYRGYDLILSCLNTTSEFYRKNGFISFTLQFGFDPAILTFLNHTTESEKQNQIGFSGSIFISKTGLHLNRFKYLAFIARKFDLILRTSAFPNKRDWDIFSKMNLISLAQGKSFSDFLDAYFLGRIKQSPVYGIDMYQFLKDTKISINIHIDSAQDQAGNVRLFETTGVGSCLLTDWKDNLNKLFIPDEEIVVFKNKKELKSKITFLLNNESERMKIALAGQKRTLKDYSYVTRFSDLKLFLQGL